MTKVKLNFSNLLKGFILFGVCSQAYAQDLDSWTGMYIVKDSDLAVIDTFKIEKSADVDPNEVTYMEALDVNRWSLKSKNNNYEDEVIAANFDYNLEEDINEYEQFGWTKLYKEGKMKCLSAGHMLFCETTPNTTVAFNPEEKFFTESGLFGIQLHYGLFNLERIIDKK